MDVSSSATNETERFRFFSSQDFSTLAPLDFTDFLEVASFLSFLSLATDVFLEPVETEEDFFVTLGEADSTSIEGEDTKEDCFVSFGEAGSTAGEETEDRLDVVEDRDIFSLAFLTKSLDFINKESFTNL